MFLTGRPSPLPPSLTRRDTLFALVLLLTLLLAASTFFATFALAALLAGLLLSVALHRLAERHDTGSPPRDPLIGINIAAIHVGGDEGGLIFVLGSIAILALGVPALRWFLIASVVAASVTAAVRIAWRQRHGSAR